LAGNKVTTIAYIFFYFKYFLSKTRKGHLTQPQSPS
jgi:hypothetical protein